MRSDGSSGELMKDIQAVPPQELLTATTGDTASVPPDAAAVVAGPASGNRQAHLAYLDGIRGLSAFYVMLFHYFIGHADAPRVVRWLTGWMGYGRLAVNVFIVLSGYCLMLPVVRAADHRLRGGVVEYLKRRARRIIPPYYAAIALSAALFWVGQHLHHSSRSPDPLALSPGNIVAHLLLVHNFSLGYYMALNPVMWSVALECQLYIVFPLLLLPLWRRFGITVTPIVGCLLGLLPLLLPYGYNYDWTSPWFMGLFALGMSAAVLSESRDGVYRSVFTRTPWLLLTACFCIGVGLCTRFISAKTYPDQVLITNDILVGLAASCLILACGLLQQQQNASHPLLRLFRSRPAVLLGAFSYSLYLMHIPVGWIFIPITNALHLSGWAGFLFSLCVKIPAACGLSYAFYLVFERPFTRAKQSSPPA